jgi:Ca2+-transporting ATPase
MDRAIRELDAAAGPGGSPFSDGELLRDYPLTRDLLAVTFAWRLPGCDALVVAAKGAPEGIAELCRLPQREAANLSDRARALGEEGLRVLGVARAEHAEELLPEDPREFAFRFVGLVGLADPVRPEVPEAICECREAGIRVVMITGDHPVTAASIAREAGLAEGGQITVITGAQLRELPEEELRRRIVGVQVFARVAPEQKLRVVRAWQAAGGVVAMTGDGVNDAPALKAADMGIAMGSRGTDVAREAADLVLLDDDFSSIVRAIRLGRRIFDNLRKAATYLIAIHVPIAGMSLLPVLFGWPLALLPVHIVLLELIIDPACSLVFEAEEEEEDVMRRPPRDLADRLFSRRSVAVALLQGAGVLAAAVVFYASALSAGRPTDAARALAFTVLISGNISLILTNRSTSRPLFRGGKRGNVALRWVLLGAALSLALILEVPPLRELFRFSGLRVWEIAAALAAGLASVLWFEVRKALRRAPRPAEPRRQ